MKTGSELVPEAYRQKFRNLNKTANQTFVEFAREKNALFEKWCCSCKVKTVEELKTLILLEEFKKCLPERIVTYLNEQKVSSLTNAALLADEFVLTHKSVFCAQNLFQENFSERKKSPKAVRKNVSPFIAKSNSRKCFYCHDSGHLIAACPVLKRKEARGTKSPAGMGLIKPLARQRCASRLNKTRKLTLIRSFYLCHAMIKCRFLEIRVRTTHSY
uniref:SCAN box domain-containing protein n=1 Tax=Neolamprologus brichardi TaxID=32507 RepID=A0A3Q4GPI4_NEOBR